MKESLLVVTSYLAFATAKNLTDPSPVLEAISNGWNVVRLEVLLNLDRESAIQQGVGEHSFVLLKTLTYFYAIGMWVGLISVAAMLFWRNREAYYELRRVFLVTLAGAILIFAVFPLAPPRFLPGFGITDTVAALGLDPVTSSDSALAYNRFAAMPSLHYTWALLVAVAMFHLPWRGARVLGIAFQALMLVAIVATGNHYIFDAAAGALLLVLSFAIVRLYRKRDPRFGLPLSLSASTAGAKIGPTRALHALRRLVSAVQPDQQLQPRRYHRRRAMELDLRSYPHAAPVRVSPRNDHPEHPLDRLVPLVVLAPFL